MAFLKTPNKVRSFYEQSAFLTGPKCCLLYSFYSSFPAEKGLWQLTYKRCRFVENANKTVPGTTVLPNRI